jgi:hypothetical protein
VSLAERTHERRSSSLLVCHAGDCPGVAHLTRGQSPDPERAILHLLTAVLVFKLLPCPHPGHVGELPARVASVRLNCSAAAWASDWAKIVPMAAATMWAFALDTLARTLRMKCRL